MYQMIGIDPALAANAVPQFTPGTYGTDDDGKVYKYLEYKEGTAAVAGVAGETAGYYTLDGYKLFQCCSDISDCTGSIGAGVLQVAVSDGDFSWVQIKGAATLSIAFTSGADGGALTLTGAGDGTIAAAVDTTASAPVNVCAWGGDVSDLEIVCDFIW